MSDEDRNQFSAYCIEEKSKLDSSSKPYSEGWNKKDIEFPHSDRNAEIIEFLKSEIEFFDNDNELKPEKLYLKGLAYAYRFLAIHDSREKEKADSDLKEAVNCLNKAIDCFDDINKNPEAQYHKGRARFYMGYSIRDSDKQKAIEYFKNAEEAFGEYLEKCGNNLDKRKTALYEIGLVLRYKGIFLKKDRKKKEGNKQLSDSINKFEEIFEINNQEYEAFYYQALANRELGNLEASIGLFNKTIELNPSYKEALYNKGVALKKLADKEKKYKEKLDKYNEAIEAFEEAIRISDKSDFTSYAWYDKGIVLQKIGRCEEALKALDKAIEIDKDYAEAKKEKEKEKVLNIFTDKLYLKAHAIYTDEKYPEAVIAFQKVIDYNPNHVGAWYYKGRSYFELNMYEYALEAFGRAIIFFPNCDVWKCKEEGHYIQKQDVWNCKGECHRILKQYSLAHNYFEKILRPGEKDFEKKDPEILNNNGLALHGLKNYPEAIENYNEAIELNKEKIKFLNNRAISYRERGEVENAISEFNNAISEFEKVLQRNPHDAYSLYHKGLTLYKKISAQINSLQKSQDNSNEQYSVNEFTKTINDLTKTSFALYCENDYSHAEDLFDKILSRNQRDNYALYYKGLSDLELGKCEKNPQKKRQFLNESINSFEKLIQINPEDADAYYNQGLAYYELEKYEDSIAFFEKAFNLNPNHFLSLFKKGSAFHKLQKYDEAISVFDKLLKKFPTYIDVLMEKGNACYDSKKFEDAIQAFEKAIKIDSLHHEAWKNKGNALRELKRYNEAIKAFDKALDINYEDTASLNDKALTFLAKGSYEDSIKTFLKVPGYENKPFTLNNIGHTYLVQDNCEKAIEYFRKALKIEPENFYSHWYEGITLYKQKNYDEALTAMDVAIECSQQNQENAAKAWNDKGLVLFAKRKYNDAIDAFDRSLWHNPKHFYAWNNKGRAFYQLEQYSKALEAFEKTLEVKKELKEDPDAYTMLYKGRVFQKLGKSKESLEAFEEAIKSSEREGSLEIINKKVEMYAWFYKAFDLLDFNKVKEADKAFEKTISLAEGLNNSNIKVSALFYKGLALRRLRKNFEATEIINIFGKEAQKGKLDPSVWKYKGRALKKEADDALEETKLEKYNNALCAYEEASNNITEQDTKTIKLVAELWYYKGLCFRSLAEYHRKHQREMESIEALENARYAYEEAIRLNSNYDEAWYSKGLVCYGLHKYNEAIKAFKKAVDIYKLSIKKNKNDFFSYYDMSLAFYALDKYTEALDTLDKALEINSNDFNLWVNRGLVFLNMGKYDESITSFEKALKINPENAEIETAEVLSYKGLALTYYGRFEDARRDFDKAINLGSKRGKEFEAEIFLYKGLSYELQVEDIISRKEAFSYWGLVYELQSLDLKRYEKALENFDLALSNNYELTDALNNKAEIYRKLGRFKEALKSLKIAKKRNHLDAKIWFYEGLIFWDLDEYDKAIESFKRAVEIDPGSIEAWNNLGSLAYELSERKDVPCKLEIYKRIHEHFKKAIQNYPNNIKAHIFQGILLLELGDSEGASEEVKTALDECSATDSEKSWAYCLQGQIEIKNKKYKQALDSFRKAISSNPFDQSFILWEAYARYLNAEFSTFSSDKKKYEEEILSIIGDLEKESLSEEISAIENWYERLFYKVEKIIGHLLLTFIPISSLKSLFLSLTSNTEFEYTIKIINENIKKYQQIDEKRKIKAHILYFTGCFYYKVHDAFASIDKLEECVNVKSGAPVEKAAKKLWNNIWDYQIKPHISWWSWWLFSPFHKWTKRAGFLILSVTLLVAFFAPLYIFLMYADLKASILDYSKTMQYALLIILLVFLILSPCIGRIKGQDIEIEMQHSPPPLIEFYPKMPPFKIGPSSIIPRTSPSDIKRCQLKLPELDDIELEPLTQ